MAKFKTPQISFSGGLVTSELFGRLDLGHNQTGCAELRNNWGLPHGPWQNRPGLEYVKECKDGGANGVVRLLEFIFSKTQAYQIEAGNLYFRFHTEGATILETSQVITGITQASVGVVTSTAHGYSDGEEVQLADISGMTELNARYVKLANITTDTYEIQDLLGNDIDTTGFTAYTSGGTNARVYTVVSPYLAADLLDIKFEQNHDILTLTHPDYTERELSRLGAASWTLDTITFEPSISAPVLTSVTASPTSGSNTQNYVVTAIADDGLEESVASNEIEVTNDLDVAANINTLIWAAVTDAIRYNVYKESNGLHGFIGQTPDLTFIDGDGTNITPDLLTSPPENRTPFGSAGNFPGAVGYFDERRIFLGTTNNPQTFYMTKTGTESNMSRSIPARDDDSIFRTLKSNKLQAIQSMVAISDMLVFTTFGEWIITSKNSDAITPTTIAARQQSVVGSSGLQALIVDDTILFSAADSFHIHDIRIPENAFNYKPRDISRVADQLFKGFTLTDWTFKQSPYPMIFATRDDGVLLGLTYVPSESPPIIAFHKHDTKFGKFESVASTPEQDGPNGGEVSTYCVILRTFNGVERRYIERFRSRRFETVEDEFIVDSGLTYDTPITITGITSANPPVVTAVAHGLTTGETVKIRDVLKLEDERITSFEEVNGKRFTVGTTTTDTVELQDSSASPANVDGTAWPAYRSGGTVREEIQILTGLHHLEGLLVSVLADGTHLGDETVVDGSITIDNLASIIHVGLEIESDFATLPLKSDGPAFGLARVSNVNSVYIKVDKSRGISAGPSFDKQINFAERTDEDYGQANKARSEDIEIKIDTKWNKTKQLFMRKISPTAVTVLSMVLEGEGND